MFQCFQISGVGLHSGKETTIKVKPAPTGKGRYFVRTDLPNNPKIMANIDSVKTTILSTELASNLTSDSPTVRTVEHLLASLYAYGLDDVEIEIDGSEVPLLDGSAQNWCQYFTDLPENNFHEIDIAITEAIWVRKDDAFVAALPSPEMRFSYGIDFPYAVLQNQWYSWYPQRESFKDAIAPARTFGFADQIEYLKKNGLIKGGSLENALVCDFDGWFNPPLRFENEAVRHKLIDLVGDLSLLGKIPQGHYLAYKASHNLHTELARKIKQNLGLKT